MVTRSMPSNRIVTAASITVIIAAIALGAGAWFYHQQAVELKARNAGLQQTKLALDRSTQQAREQLQALNDGIKSGEQHQQSQQQLSLRAAHLANGFDAAGSVKTAVAEYFITYGKWPTSNREAGISDPGSYKADNLSAITVLPDGRIRMTFVDNGKQQQVWLHGLVNKAMQVLWKCTTPDIADIAKLIPACAYGAK